MAKPYTGNTPQDENHSFTPDRDGNAARNVVDKESHDILNAINNALGGSTDTSVNIYNVSTSASVEGSQILPVNCKGFVIKARGNSKVQIAYSSGQTTTAFLTIWPGSKYEDKNFYSNQTVYFQTSKDDVIEIITFS